MKINKPTQLIIHVTNRCNLSCPYCMNRHLLKEEPYFINIPRACIKIQEYFNECTKNNLETDIYLGGCESTIHPKFHDLTNFIYKRKPDVFTLTTNGRLKHNTYYMFTSIHVSNHMSDLNQEKEQIDKLLLISKNIIFNYVYLENDDYILDCYKYINNRARIKVFENIFEKDNKPYVEKYNNLIQELNISRSSNDLPPRKEILFV